MGKIKILKTGITSLETDALVNAANEHLQAGAGVCGIIFNAAGYSQLQDACDKIGKCPTGSAVITPGFNTKSKYIIHAVGPRWTDGKHKEPQLLYGAYKESLRLAVKNNCKSIGFPLISAGIFGYPVEQAWRKAIQACVDFQKANRKTPLDITFAVIDDNVLATGQKVLAELNKEYTSQYLTTLNETSFLNFRSKLATQSDHVIDKKVHPMAGGLFGVLCEKSVIRNLSVDQVIRIIDSIFPTNVLEEAWLAKYCDFMLRVIEIPNRKTPDNRAAKYEQYLRDVLIPAQRKGANTNDIWDDVDTLVDIYKVCTCLYRYYSRKEKAFDFNVTRDDMERLNEALFMISSMGGLFGMPAGVRLEDRQYTVILSWILEELLCVQEDIITED